MLQGKLRVKANTRKCICSYIWLLRVEHMLKADFKPPMFCYLAGERSVPLAITNSLAFYKVVEQSSRLWPSSIELCGPSSALGCHLHIPGLLSGDLYQKLMPSWDHCKAYMSALATSTKVWINAARELQGKEGGTYGGDGRVVGKGTGQEGPNGVQVPDKAKVLVALAVMLQDLLVWSAGEGDSMSSSSGNVCNAVTSSAGGFGVPEELFAPRGIQLVVLLWAARGLGVVGPLLLPLTNKERDAEVAAFYESRPVAISSSRNRNYNIKGIVKSGSTVEGGGSSGGIGGIGNSSSSNSSSSSSSGAGPRSSSTGDESIREWVFSGVPESLKPLHMLMTTSFNLIQAMDNWQSAAVWSSAAAEHGVSAELKNLETAPSSSSSSSNDAPAAAAAPTSHGTVPKRLAKLPRSGLPAAVVDQLNLVTSKWDLKQYLDDEGRPYISRDHKPSREQQVEFVGDVVHLAEVLLAEVHTPLGCSNPRCVNLAGPSEIQLARKSCNACKVVYYCSRECQTAHWGTHKHQCKKLKQQHGDKQQGSGQGEQGTQQKQL